MNNLKLYSKIFMILAFILLGKISFTQNDSTVNLTLDDASEV